MTRSYLVSLFVHLAATLVTLVSPNLAAARYAAIAVFHLAESAWLGGLTADTARSETL